MKPAPPAEDTTKKKFIVGKEQPDMDLFFDSEILKITPTTPHKVHKIFVFHDGEYIYGLEVYYRFGPGFNMLGSSAPHIGKEGYLPTVSLQKDAFELGKDEYIVQINGRSGEWIDRLEFITNKGNYYVFGGDGGGPFSFKAEFGCQFTLFTMGVGNHLDFLEFVQTPGYHV